MKLIVGLGNPGAEYDNTRHNIGFDVIDELSRKHNIPVRSMEKHGLVGKGMIGSDKVMLVKPQTFMNISGVCVAGLVDYYSLDMEDVIIIYDDVTLDIGKIRLRPHGSAGGHNGIKNIIAHLGTQVFPRIKVGVGEKPKKYDLADYVLSHFTKAERKEMEEGYQKAIQAVEKILAGEMEAAMNEFNRKVKPKEA